jgi:hypothetical protein
VSWKRTRGQGHGHYTKSSGGYRNRTATFDAQEGDHGKRNLYENHEIVTEFLAFVLLLPDHPFSNDLYSSVVTVAPMFPRVIFVIGNANEFTELCAQYGVRSFPKLLFFQEGSLRGKHTERHTSWEIAAEISKWTNLLPSALPAVRLSRTTRPKKALPFKMEFPLSHPSNVITKLLSRWKPDVDIGSSIEPIAVSHESLLKYDLYILLISSIYVFGRILIFATSLER